MEKRMKIAAIATAVAAVPAFLTGVAQAATGTWLGNGNAWNDSAAWSGGTIADGSGFTANFTGVNITSDVSMALGVDRTIGGITFTDAIVSSHNLTLTGNTLTLTGSVNVTQADRNLTISSVIGGTSGFAKTGQGTLTLTGANTHNGSSSINNGGTLVLDYSSQNNRKLTSGALTLNGGTIIMRGGSATETVSSTNLQSNNLGTFFVRDGGTSKINLNGTAVTGTQSVVSFSHDSMATTDRANIAGILGSWFTVGNRWAANSTGGADGNIVGYTGGTTFTPAAVTSMDVNYDLAGGATLTASRPTNTLRIESTANDQILNLGTFTLQTSNANGTNALSGTAGGLLYAGGANGNYTINGTGTIFGENGNGQSFLINVFSGTLNVNAFVGAGSSTFIKSGAGTLILNGNNTGLDGSSRILQGALRARSANALGDDAADTITVQNGAALEVANNIALASKTSMSITGMGVSNDGALRNFANNNSYAGAITIGTGGARINSDSGTLTLSGGVVTASGNDVTFGGAGNTTVSTTAISGGGGLIKDGAGTTTLSATNSYTGSTAVNAGKLLINGNNSSATGAVTVASTATLGGSGTIGGSTTVSGTHSPGTSPGIQTFAGGLSYTTGSNLTWELIADADVTRGTQYDGVNVTGGTLSIATGAISNLVFNGSGSTVDWTDTFWDTNQSWLVYDNASAPTLSSLDIFDTINVSADSAAQSFALTGGGFAWRLDGNDVYLDYVVPEPTSLGLLAMGAVGLMRRRSR